MRAQEHGPKTNAHPYLMHLEIYIKNLSFYKKCSFTTLSQSRAIQPVDFLTPKWPAKSPKCTKTWDQKWRRF